MPRERFTEDKEYAGRLLSVRERPVENSKNCHIHLLRLEFEIFQIFQPKQQLSSLGKIACRDIVIGSAIDVTRDTSLAAYVQAMGLKWKQATDPAPWISLAAKKPWVVIEFGELDPSDSRNSFRKIHSLDVKGWAIQEYDFAMNKDWVTITEAAMALECSPSTLRRVIEKYEPTWGNKLVWRTTGSHRRINLGLLRNLK